MAFLT